ncbi:MAG TPA: hypothetical protein VFB62_24195, partial [Polyangiaceae bacterium]|nr:hypothetical protein [Polyangiaceae bacterium]
GDEPVIDYQGQWGEIGEWCDPAALAEYEAAVAELVKKRYPGLVIPDRHASWDARQPVIAKLVKVITVSIHIALDERGVWGKWTPDEVNGFTMAVLAQIYQDSYFSQYKMVDGKLRLMRGNKGSAHGLTQIGEQSYFDAVYKEDAGWDLLENLNRGLNLLLDRWEEVKTRQAQGSAPCVEADGKIDLHALGRAAYSVLKTGKAEAACRWKDAPVDADTRYESRYQKLVSEDLEAKYGWVTTYPAAREGLEDIDFVGILGLEAMPGEPQRPVCTGSEAEANDTEALAVRLDSSDDCDGNGTGSSGALAGSKDVDWFYFEGFDVPYCIVNPTVELTSQAPGARVCSFFDCLSGDAQVTCPTGTTSATSELGRAGCCGPAGSMKVSVNCAGTATEDIDVFMRVDVPGGEAQTCYSYSLKYHY